MRAHIEEAERRGGPGDELGTGPGAEPDAGPGAGPGAGVRADQGISTIEVVVLAPIMILFILVLVAFGQLVDGRGAVDSAARDAARAGSIQHDQSVAMSQAVDAAEADLGDTCVDGSLVVRQTSAGFESGTLFTVEVSCTIRGLASLGLDIQKTLTTTASSPLDPYRESVPN